MRGRAAASAEVAGRRDQRLAEMVHPDAVDDDPAGERIVGRGDRPGEIEPAAAVGKRQRWSPARTRRNCRGTRSPGWRGRPARKRAARQLGRVGQDHGPGAALARPSRPSGRAPPACLRRRLSRLATCRQGLALGEIGRAVVAGHDLEDLPGRLLGSVRSSVAGPVVFDFS